MTRTEMADPLQIAVFPSELAWIGVAWSGNRVFRVTFGHKSPRKVWQKLAVAADPGEPDRFMAAVVERLQAFAGGDRSDEFLDVELATDGMTDFQRAVTQHCRQIRVGQTRSYGELASLVGHPGAARAVGRVMATNHFPLIVPCHRVVAAGGAIGGFSAPNGVAMKRRLLEPEL
jgi:methylated-DNA-[protein]-cysteine S-methyltransferase